MQRIVLEFKSIKQACRKLDRNYRTVMKRMQDCRMTKEEALIKPTKTGYNDLEDEKDRARYTRKTTPNNISNEEIMLKLEHLQRELDYIKNKLNK